MTIEQSLFTALSDSASVAALIGNGDSPTTVRLYPEVAPDEVTRPYAVYSVISAVKPMTFSGRSTLENARIQIDCYSDTYAEARTLSDTILAAVDDGMSLGDNQATTFYEREPRLHRFSLDLSLWE